MSTRADSETLLSTLRLRNHSRRYWLEHVVVGILAFCALVSVAITISIVAVLIFESSGFFQDVSPVAFFTGKRWAPLFKPESFGILPLLTGSFLVAAISCAIAIPAGLGIAIYLAEYANHRQRSWMKPTLELLAGIPSVVFGFFALTTITPVLRSLWPETEVFNALSAGIVVGVMTFPLVASLSDDAICAVSKSLKDAGYALGATKYEVIRTLVVPSAASGILASFILALSRAIGETMAVSMAAGSTANFTLNPLQSVQTMTAFIAQISMGDTPHGSVAYQTIFVVGLVLFVITMLTNSAAAFLNRRLRNS
jgi:phosphate transport system permease protein